MGTVRHHYIIHRSIGVDKNGIIVAGGPNAEIAEQFKDSQFEKEIDATGRFCGTQ